MILCTYPISWDQSLITSKRYSSIETLFFFNITLRENAFEITDVVITAGALQGR